jgi:hypothetical protein
MSQRLTIDFVTEFLPERHALLKLLNGARLTAVVQGGKLTEPEIELDRGINTYSHGEKAVITFVQTPTRPLDLSLLSGEIARAALDLHTKFWSKRLGA